jgi:hypothetical protein
MLPTAHCDARASASHRHLGLGHAVPERVQRRAVWMSGRVERCELPFSTGATQIPSSVSLRGRAEHMNEASSSVDRPPLQPNIGSASVVFEAEGPWHNPQTTLSPRPGDPRSFADATSSSGSRVVSDSASARTKSPTQAGHRAHPLRDVSSAPTRRPGHRTKTADEILAPRHP